MTDQFRALAQQGGETATDEELLETMDQAVAAFPPLHPEAENLCAVEYEIALQVRKARAVLARWGRPVPQPVADGEVGELVAALRSRDRWMQLTDAHVDRAADLLTRIPPQSCQ